MLAMVFLVVPSTLGFFLWSSYRADKKRPDDFVPADGRQRWDVE